MWGYLGAAAAAWFAIWMLFFPQSVPTHFAWDVQPRYAQAFIGAGYIFRTVFFLYVAREPNWLRLRWIVWGNLAFTGALLLATFWHIDEFLWPQFVPPTAHIWVILYVFEPVTMLYLIPRGIFRGRGAGDRRPAPPALPQVPRPRHRAAADARPAADHQPGVRRDDAGRGSSTRSTPG